MKIGGKEFQEVQVTNDGELIASITDADVIEKAGYKVVCVFSEKPEAFLRAKEAAKIEEKVTQTIEVLCDWIQKGIEYKALDFAEESFSSISALNNLIDALCRLQKD